LSLAGAQTLRPGSPAPAPGLRAAGAPAAGAAEAEPVAAPADPRPRSSGAGEHAVRAAWSASRPALALSALAVAAVAALLAELIYGPVHIPLSDIVATLRGEADRATEAILLQIRAPRAALGVAVGAGLALAGTALQGVLRNPLADPQLIGVSAGASVGAVAVIVFGAGLAAALPAALSVWLLPAAAFLGAAAVTAFVFAFSRRAGETSVATLILAGVAANAIAMAGVGAMIFAADDQQLRELTFWTMGGLGAAGPAAVSIAGGAALVAGIGLARMGRALDLLQLGERAAFHAGLDVERAKLAAAGWSALAVGAVTAFAGPIGFIGLCAPHLARLLVGPNHRLVLPAAALAGVALTLAADLVARTAVPPAEPPIGIATALIGGPFFLWLLMSRLRRSHA
tara:strand:- start:288 stop:1484 length:1197 start_codon:yes stop_codon:yes gene_type:complete